MTKCTAIYWIDVLSNIDFLSMLISMTCGIGCLVFLFFYALAETDEESKKDRGICIICIIISVLFAIMACLIPEKEIMDQMIQQNQYMDLSLIPQYIEKFITITVKIVLIIYLLYYILFKIKNRGDNSV